ncbi:MAG: hypothetical protein QW128_01445 [Thermoprotei archaeon]
MTSERTESKALMVALTSMNAVLYFAGSYVTSYIESPYGIGQFRPAVVIPFYFAVVFGPYVGGVGAAIGTLLASILRYGQPWLSLVSGTPANFISFYLVGLLLHKKFSWTRFILVAIVTSLIGNSIAALGVLLAAYIGLYPPIQFVTMLPFYSQLGFVIGLTLFWFITMSPFTLFLIPILLKSTTVFLPENLAKQLSSINIEKEYKTLSITLLIIGFLSLTTSYAATSYPSILGAASRTTMEAIKTLFLIIGVAFVITSIILLIVAKIRR